MSEVKSRIENVIKSVEHPEINYTLFELGMLDDIEITEQEVNLTLKVPMLGVPIRDYLVQKIVQAVKQEADIKVNVSITEMNESERIKFMQMAQEAWRG